MAFQEPILVDLQQHVANDRILFFGDGVDKEHALRQLAELIAHHADVGDPAAFVRAIFEREAVSTTGIGRGIAVPHAKLPSIDGFVIAIGVSRAGIDFEAKDERPVRIVVMIAASDRERETYLRLLATVAATLKRDEVCQAIVGAADAETVIEALTGAGA